MDPLRYHLAYTTWREVSGGSVMPLAEVRQRFARYSLPAALGALQRMEYLLARAERPDGRVQAQIGMGLLGKQRWDALARGALRAHGAPPPGQNAPFFWHPELVLNAAKVAFMVCPDSDEAPRAWTDLGEAVLGLSDHIAPNLDGFTEEERTSRLAHHMAVNAVLNESERPHVMLPLAYDLYLQAHDSLRSHPHWVDLRSLLERATGLAPERLMGIGLAAWTFWATQDTDRIHEGVKVLNLGAFLGSTDVRPEEIELFLSLVSRDAEAMRQEVGKHFSSSDLKPLSFRPFAETPLVRVGEVLYCVSFKLLLRRITTDLHFFFVQYLPDDLRNEYFNFHGVAFEALVHDTLEASCRRRRRQRQPGPINKYLRIDALRTPPGRKKADGLLLRGDTAVVLDAKAGRVPDAMLREDEAAFRAYLEQTVLKAAAQISETIDDIRAGLYDLPRGHKPTRFVPVLVALQYPGWNHLLAKLVDRELAKRGLLSSDGVLSVQVAELQALLVLAENGVVHGSDPVELFRKRAADLWHRGQSLQNYLIECGEVVTWSTPRLRRKSQQVFDLAREMLVGSGGEEA